MDVLYILSYIDLYASLTGAFFCPNLKNTGDPTGGGANLSLIPL